MLDVAEEGAPFIPPSRTIGAVMRVIDSEPTKSGGFAFPAPPFASSARVRSRPSGAHRGEPAGAAPRFAKASASTGRTPNFLGAILRRSGKRRRGEMAGALMR